MAFRGSRWLTHPGIKENLSASLDRSVLPQWHAPPRLEERQLNLRFANDPYKLREEVSLSDAIADFLQSKTSGGFKTRYVTSLRQLLRRFEKEISPATLGDSTIKFERWMYAQNWKRTSLASNLGRMSSFFRFCLNRKMISENPCERFERPRIHHKTPTILSAEQCEIILAWTIRNRPEMLAFLVLALFSGVRPEELEKLGWGAVNLQAEHVCITAEASKVNRRRITPIAPNAMKWLRIAKRSNAYLPATQSTRKRFIRQLRVRLHLDAWPQDVLRHTAASFLLAKVPDAGRVSLWLGNSAKILMTHYREMVPSKDAKRFWNIKPKRFRL